MVAGGLPRGRVGRPGWTVIPLALTLGFLYLPIAVVVIMAFNESGSPYHWSGFSTQWFSAARPQRADPHGSVQHARGRRRLDRWCRSCSGPCSPSDSIATSRSGWIDALSMGPAVAPDIIMAIGLLGLYTTVGLTLGLHSVLLSHIVFGTALVAAVVRARLGHTDPHLEEASRDLGASQLTTFLRITIPGVWPAIVAGGLLAFTLSLDEFVIAFFTDGPSTPTLPIVIYSMVRFGVTPEVNALAAVLLLVSFVTVLVAQRLTGVGADD